MPCNAEAAFFRFLPIICRLRVIPLKHEKMAVIWLSADKRAAADMAFLYIRTSLINRWWKSCELILWGPAVETAATDQSVQTELMMLINLGAEVKACEACALRYGVLNKLSDLGIASEGMGEHLTALLSQGVPLLMI